MTDEELMDWMLEGGWIAADARMPRPNEAAEWCRPEWGGAIVTAVTGLPKAHDVNSLYWRHPRQAEEPTPDTHQGRIVGVPMEDGRRGVSWRVNPGDVPPPPPKPGHTRIVHAWHTESGALFALDETGRIWARSVGALEWKEVPVYPPGCDPRG